MTVLIDPDGRLRFVYDDALTGMLSLGIAAITRASHVEPSPNGWTADLSPVNGPILGPFKLRGKALAAELDWLEQNLSAT